jgi:hypothetical protein
MFQPQRGNLYIHLVYKLPYTSVHLVPAPWLQAARCNNVIQQKVPIGQLSLLDTEKGTERTLINQIPLNNTLQPISSFTKMIVLFRTKWILIHLACGHERSFSRKFITTLTISIRAIEWIETWLAGLLIMHQIKYLSTLFRFLSWFGGKQTSERGILFALQFKWSALLVAAAAQAEVRCSGSSTGWKDKGVVTVTLYWM